MAVMSLGMTWQKQMNLTMQSQIKMMMQSQVKMMMPSQVVQRRNPLSQILRLVAVMMIRLTLTGLVSAVTSHPTIGPSPHQMLL